MQKANEDIECPDCGNPNVDAEYSRVEAAISGGESVITDTFIKVTGCGYCGCSGLFDA